MTPRSRRRSSTCNFCNITSPIAGRTGLRRVDVGNLIHSGDATGIVTVSQLHPIAVTFTLPQDDLPAIHDAMHAGPVPVFAYTADDKQLLAEGKLLTIDNEIDQATGTIKLKAEFPNQDDKLWPGQFVNVRMQTETLKNALAVPSAAVQRGPQGLYVYVVKPDSTVAMQPIQVQQDDGKIGGDRERPRRRRADRRERPIPAAIRQPRRRERDRLGELTIRRPPTKDLTR